MLAVKVDNSQQPNSRWYSGSGIYRNVWLVKTGKVHVDLWGTQVLTPTISEAEASISIATRIRNSTSDLQKGILETSILDQNGNIVLKRKAYFKISADSTGLVKQDFTLENPVLWTLNKPVLYKAINKVLVGKTEFDKYQTAVNTYISKALRIAWSEFTDFSFNSIRTSVFSILPESVSDFKDAPALPIPFAKV